MNNSEQIFNKYAEEYLQKYGNMDLYSETLEIFLKNLDQNSELLELACGPGNLTKKLLSMRPDLNILGLDIAGNMVNLAKVNNPMARFLRMDCRFMSGIDKEFDAVIAGFLLPYLNSDEVRKLFRDVNSLLKVNGMFFLSTMESEEQEERCQTSDSHKHEKLITNDHEKSQGRNKLKMVDCELEGSYSLENYQNRDGLKDLILIARKKDDLN